MTGEETIVSDHVHHVAPVPGCDWCAVRPLIGDLHRVFLGKAGPEMAERIWELQDGNSVGLAGFTGPEGRTFDAIRRSTPDAVIAMWDEVYGHGVD